MTNPSPLQAPEGPWRCRAVRSHGLCNTANDACDERCGACNADRPATPHSPYPDAASLAECETSPQLHTQQNTPNPPVSSPVSEPPADETYLRELALSSRYEPAAVAVQNTLTTLENARQQIAALLSECELLSTRVADLELAVRYHSDVAAQADAERERLDTHLTAASAALCEDSERRQIVDEQAAECERLTAENAEMAEDGKLLEWLLSQPVLTVTVPDQDGSVGLDVKLETRAEIRELKTRIDAEFESWPRQARASLFSDAPRAD